LEERRSVDIVEVGKSGQVEWPDGVAGKGREGWQPMGGMEDL